MTLTLEHRLRYDMPASFGPSAIPELTTVATAEALVLTAVTDRAQVEPLVPAHFTVPEEPTLTVAHMAYHGVDYLGGRSYKEVVVSVAAQFCGESEEIRAQLALALWVDQPGAMIAGREFMGLPKLMGHISDLDGNQLFSCREYEAPIIEGQAADLQPLSDERLERLNARAGEVRTFGWKYIAAAGGGSDVDQPLLNVMRWTYDKAWSGSGAFRFIPAAFQDAPLSCAVIDRLAQLPLLSQVRAFRGVGQAVIDRTATRKLTAA